MGLVEHLIYEKAQFILFYDVLGNPIEFEISDKGVHVELKAWFREYDDCFIVGTFKNRREAIDCAFIKCKDFDSFKIECEER